MPHITDADVRDSMITLHRAVDEAFHRALDGVTHPVSAPAGGLRAEHRQVERCLRELEHAVLLRMVQDAETKAGAMTRYLKVGVQLAQISDMARAMAVTTSAAQGIELDAVSIAHAVGGRLQERMAAAVTAFMDLDVEAARTLEDGDPTVAVLLDKLHDVAARRAPHPPAAAKCASHLRLVDSLIRSIAGLTRSAGAPSTFLPEGR